MNPVVYADAGAGCAVAAGANDGAISRAAIATKTRGVKPERNLQFMVVLNPLLEATATSGSVEWGLMSTRMLDIQFPFTSARAQD
jgi:hypothetical protein